jgi:hypothetical protein
MDAQNVFPLDITERRPGVRPWKFRPEGFLVLVMAGEDEAARAEGSLVAAGSPLATSRSIRASRSSRRTRSTRGR